MLEPNGNDERESSVGPLGTGREGIAHGGNGDTESDYLYYKEILSKRTRSISTIMPSGML